MVALLEFLYYDLILWYGNYVGTMASSVMLDLKMWQSWILMFSNFLGVVVVVLYLLLFFSLVYLLLGFGDDPRMWLHLQNFIGCDIRMKTSLIIYGTLLSIYWYVNTYIFNCALLVLKLWDITVDCSNNFKWWILKFRMMKK